MTARPTAPPPADSASAPGSFGLAARAARTGLCAALILVAAALLSGALPDGAAGYVVGGAALAALCGLLGCVLLARMARAPAGGDGRLQAMRIQTTLAMTLGIKLFAVAIGVGLLWLQGVKFPELAAFAIAFAAVALVFQLASAVTTARLLTGSVAGGRSGPTGKPAGSPQDLAGSPSNSSSAPSD